MDLDSKVGQTTSKILQTVLLIIFIISCRHNKDEANKKSSNTELAQANAGILSASDSASGKKTIYLTFDDGPNKGTGNVLAIAEEEKIPISMFLIGVQLHGSPGQEASYRRILKNNLIEVANHSYTHAHNHFDRFYTKPQEVINDFARCADSLHLTDKIVRTPGRNIWRTQRLHFTDMKKSSAAADSFYNAGFKAMGWDMEWPFDNHLSLTKTSAEILQRIDSFFAKNITRTPNQLVLLAHDQTFADSADAASLHMLIKQLKADGRYQFKLVSAYPGLKN
jgi:peptidoglycan/xylan/chitin deacetylase (PgdA/CDA1 family)